MLAGAPLAEGPAAKYLVGGLRAGTENKGEIRAMPLTIALRIHQRDEAAPVLGMQSALSVPPLHQSGPHRFESLWADEAAELELYDRSTVNWVESGGLLEINCFMGWANLA